MLLKNYIRLWSEVYTSDVQNFVLDRSLSASLKVTYLFLECLNTNSLNKFCTSVLFDEVQMYVFERHVYDCARLIDYVPIFEIYLFMLTYAATMFLSVW